MQRILDVLEHQHDAIMARWLDQAGRAASARGLDRPALANIIPHYLAALAVGQDGSEQVERHLATRLRQGFQLAEIVDEFALLSRCIVAEAFNTPLEERPDANEIDALYNRIQSASSSVVSMFDEHMRRDEQLQKRYARLLRDVALKALHSGDVDAIDPFFEVRATAAVWPLRVVSRQVRHRGRRPVPVKRVRLVRNREEQGASRADDTDPVLQGANGILRVFDHVGGNEEVTARWRDLSEDLTVIDDVWLHQLLATKLGILNAQRSGAHPVDVANVDFAGDGQRRMERAELDP